MDYRVPTRAEGRHRRRSLGPSEKYRASGLCAVVTFRLRGSPLGALPRKPTARDFGGVSDGAPKEERLGRTQTRPAMVAAGHRTAWDPSGLAASAISSQLLKWPRGSWQPAEALRGVNLGGLDPRDRATPRRHR